MKTEFAPEIDQNKIVFACLLFDCMGTGFKLCFDSEAWAKMYAYNHGLDLDFCSPMSVREAEKRGYEY